MVTRHVPRFSLQRYRLAEKVPIGTRHVESLRGLVDSSFSTPNAPRLYLNSWLRGDVIGEGAFGTVHMGLNLDTGELMAVKSIGLDQGEMTKKDAEAFVNEVAILQDNK